MPQENISEELDSKETSQNTGALGLAESIVAQKKAEVRLRFKGTQIQEITNGEKEVTLDPEELKAQIEETLKHCIPAEQCFKTK